MNEASDPITVAGIAFTERCPTHGNVFYSPQHILKLQVGPPHPNKVNDLDGEVAILKALAKHQLACVPKFHASGTWQGNPYVVIERILGLDELPKRSAVMRSFEQLMRCGYLHGDLKGGNIIWDGRTAFLIDFDQTIYDASFTVMSIEEACRWSDAHGGEQPWKNCYPLRVQLFAELQKYTTPE